MYFEALQRSLREQTEKETKKRLKEKKPLVFCDDCGWHAECECGTIRCHYGHLPTDEEISVCGFGDKLDSDVDSNCSEEEENVEDWRNIECWQTVEGYHNFMISNHGRIKNRNAQQIINSNLSKDGYLCVDLYKFGKNDPYQNAKLCIVHIDKNKANNHLSNLMYKKL